MTAPDTDDDFADPEVKALRQQITGLQDQLQQLSNTQQQSFHSEGQRMIEDFKSAKDADGKDAHPFFDECLPLITPLVQSGKTLEEAYDQVKWSVPEYRKANTPKPAPTAEEKAQKVKKARKAANAVKSPKGNTPDTAEAELSLEDELTAAFKEASQ
jgi:hypothetical protein